MVTSLHSALSENLCVVMGVGRRVADKKVDCHTEALHLAGHASMLLDDPLFIMAVRSGQLRDPLSENTDQLALLVLHTTRQGQEVGLHDSGPFSLVIQFLMKRLTCQSVIDQGGRVEEDGPGCSV